MRTSVLALAAAGALAASSVAMAQFNESFETMPSDITSTIGTPPGVAVSLTSGTWRVLNNSVPVGTTGVFRAPSAAGATSPFAVSPGDGTFYAAMNFNNTTGANTIDTYLMTPVVTLENGDTFSFITRTVNSPAFPDRLRVKLSTSSSATPVAADFSVTLLSINETLTTTGYPNAWTAFSATVSGLSGPTQGRLAFNYNVTGGGPSGANSDFIGIDRAVFAKIPEPATLSLLASGLPVLLRRRRA